MANNKLKLLKIEIEDRYSQENFKRIEKHVNDIADGVVNIVNNTTISNSVKAEEAAKLIFTKKLTANTPAFSLVRLVSNTHVDVTDDGALATSSAIGLTLETKNAGEDVRILTFGIAEDASFTYGIYVKLFVGSSGTITDTPTTLVGEFVTPIGEGLGLGSIFIKIGETEEIV